MRKNNEWRVFSLFVFQEKDISLTYPDVGRTARFAAPHLLQGEGRGSVLLLLCSDGVEGAKPHLQRKDTNTCML